MTAVDPVRAAWLEDRRKGIGASDVAGILRLSPWASPYSIWVDKVFGSDDEGESAAMSFGRRAEPMVAAWFHELTGLYVAGEQSSVRHPDHAHHRATLDGYVYETRDDADDRERFGKRSPADALGPLEIKTTSATPKDWETDGIPMQYQCQGQWTLHVTGADTLWFAVLHLAFGRPELKVYQLARDPDDIATIVDEVDRFWHDHVLTGKPPATDNHPATTYATKHLPASAGDMVNLTVEAVVARMHLADLKAQAKELEAKIDTAENVIRAALGDATEGYDHGALVVSHRPQKRRGIDTDAFRSAMPVTASKFATESEYRVLRLHTPAKPKKGK